MDEQPRENLPPMRASNTRDAYGLTIDKRALDAYAQWCTRDLERASDTSERLDNFFNVSRKIAKEREVSKICLDPIPTQFRGRIWATMLHTKQKSRAWPNYYNSLLEMINTLGESTRVQIDKDLSRAFPEMSEHRDAYNETLRRVLCAYATRHTLDGYTQGQNYIAGSLIMFLDEEDAFWAMCTMCEEILVDYYTQDMHGVYVDCKIFSYYVSLYFPVLDKHLRSHDITLAAHTIEWFMCLYTKTLPIETAFRVWDDILRRGIVALFEYALRIIKYLERTLLAHKTSEDIQLTLMNGARDIVDFSTLQSIRIEPPLQNAIIEMRRLAFGERLAERLLVGKSPY